MKKRFFLLAAAVIGLTQLTSCNKDEGGNNNNDGGDNNTLTEGTFVVDGTTYTVCPNCFQSGENNGKYVWEYHGVYDSKFVKITFPAAPVTTGTYQIESKTGDPLKGSTPAAGKVQIWFQFEIDMFGTVKKGYKSYDSSTGEVKATVNSDGTIKISFTDITVQDETDPSHIVKASGNYVWGAL